MSNAVLFAASVVPSTFSRNHTGHHRSDVGRSLFYPNPHIGLIPHEILVFWLFEMVYTTPHIYHTGSTPGGLAMLLSSLNYVLCLKNIPGVSGRCPVATSEPSILRGATYSHDTRGIRFPFVSDGSALPCPFPNPLHPVVCIVF